MVIEDGAIVEAVPGSVIEVREPEPDIHLVAANEAIEEARLLIGINAEIFAAIRALIAEAGKRKTVSIVDLEQALEEDPIQLAEEL